MPLRAHSLKALAVVCASLFVGYLLFGWLALPRIVESQAEQYITRQTGHRLTLDRPRFNPFTLNLHLSNLRLEEPNGKPLFALRELTVNLSLASLFRRALVFDGVRLDGPQATVIVARDGRLNWSALGDALGGAKEKQTDAPPRELSLPRFKIHSLVMHGGAIDFADERNGFTTQISPVDFEVNDISTLRNDRDHYKISAQLGFGAHILWEGEATLNPVGVAGSLAIENVELARLAPYVRDVLPVAPPSGVASLSTDYHLTYAGGRLDLSLENFQANLTNFGLNGPGSSGPAVAIKSIAARNGHFDLVAHKFALGTLTLTGSRVVLPRANGIAAEMAKLGVLTLGYLQFDLARRNIMVGRVTLKEGRLQAVRDATGRIDVFAAFGALTPSAAKAEPETRAPASLPWHYRVNKVELENCSASFYDETVVPTADLSVTAIAASVDGISDDLSLSLPVRISLRARDGGDLQAVGQVIPAAPSADFHIKLSDLVLKPAQPYVTSVARLVLRDGRFSTEGRATYGRLGAGYKGSFAVRDLTMREADTNDVFLAWKALGSRDLEVTQSKLQIGRLDVERLNTKLIINKDRSVNISYILRKPQPPARPAAPASALNTPVAAASEPSEAALLGNASTGTGNIAPPFLVNIDRVRISNSEMDFADLSLVLPFETHIHKLRGFVNGLSSQPGAPGQLELDGQVDAYGMVRAVGQIELFNPSDFTDVKVMFGNVEMTRLSPYSSTFAGRRIDSGKLMLNLQYKVKQQRLAGDNQIVIDKLTLGERVKSPQALDLPLDLAIAILEDSDRRIDLGLPVSGSINDPQFSYGGIVWKAIMNVFKMIVTAPFRALASLFGGEVKIENVYFDPGAAELSPPERENVIRLAGAFNKRPRLFVTVHGTWSDADRVALQDLQLRRKVASKAGTEVGPSEDPGPLSTRSPKVQAGLESLFADKFGRGELNAVKEGFRKANPGQMEEGFVGRMMSRLTGLFGGTRPLPESEIEQLKGADFYAVLFNKLRLQETIPDLALQSLATSRGDVTYAALKAAQAPAERLTLGAPQKGENDEKGVPVNFDLGTAPKAAAAPDLGQVAQ